MFYESKNRTCMTFRERLFLNLIILKRYKRIAIRPSIFDYERVFLSVFLSNVACSLWVVAVSGKAACFMDKMEMKLFSKYLGK